jgi:hypothetical protein
MGIYDKIADPTSSDAGKPETGIGTELAEKMKSVDQGMKAAKGDESTPADRDTSGKGVGGTAKPYGSQGKEKRLNVDYLKKPTDIKTYDKGGKVNVNDGKHEVAILKHGERVLTEKQNKEYEAEHPEKKGKDMDCYDEGGTVHSPEEKAHFARSMHKLHGGALHRHFGIAEDKPIPMAKKQEAANSSNAHVAAMGRLAVSMHGWKRGKK